jgi:hypothetical protein
MSELDDLLAVYGRIDDAVVHDPSLRPTVAAMLPPYRQGAAGWYRSFQDWQAAEATPQLAAPPTFSEALDNLVDFAPSDLAEDDYYGWANRHWINSRRMLASATLGRIQGRLDLPTNADPGTLVQRIATDGGGDPTSGRTLQGHLRRVADYPSIESWPRMMEHARQRGLVDEAYQNATYVPPVAWEPGSFRVVRTSVGTSVALRTHYHAPDLDLAEAKNCLFPELWGNYHPPWCGMQKIGDPAPDVEQFQEVISTNCDPGTGVSTVLNFSRRNLPDGGGILVYRVPEGDFLPASDRAVSIDEGSLEVRAPRPGDGVHFVTTKRIQFTVMRDMPAMPAAALGFLVWVMGWDTLSERFLYFLSRQKAPNVAPTADGAAGSAFGIDPSIIGRGDLMTVLNLGINGWQNYVRDCVGGVRTSVNRAAAGDYGVTDYLGDLTKLSNEVSDNTVALAELGAQLYRVTLDADGPGQGGQGGSGGAPPPAAGPPGAGGGGGGGGAASFTRASVVSSPTAEGERPPSGLSGIVRWFGKRFRRRNRPPATTSPTTDQPPGTE